MTVKELIMALADFDPDAIVTDGEEEIIVRVIDNQGDAMIESDYKSRQNNGNS